MPFANERAALELIRRRLSNAVNNAAEATQSEIRAVLEESRVGSGVFYPGNKNRSSAPGEPPARQTGRLMESLKILERSTRLSLRAEVGPDAKAFPKAYYPRFLEFGTRRIAPRPFMRVGIDRVKRKVLNLTARS